MRLKDKVAIVTGGGSGIGQAIAQLFAREGARLVIVDWVEERAQETARSIKNAGGEAWPVVADVSQKEMVEAMVARTMETYGRIDILVTSAVIARGEDILDIDQEIWDADLGVVLNGVFLSCKAVVPIMIEQQQGVIVNIASVNGLAAFGHMPYSAAKAGVINLTKNMAVSYGQYHIRVNAICPGTVRTPVWKERFEKDPHIFERLAKWYPLGRVGEPEDIANAALFLVSDEAAWITGQALIVDGGLTAGTYRLSQELAAKMPE